MRLATWNPIGELEAVRHRLERVWRRVWNGADAGRPEASERIHPPVELFLVEPDTLVVRVELPGAQLDDLGVDLAEEALMVTGIVRREGPADAAAYFRSERMYGRFERTVPLPTRVDARAATASFRHGLLTVRMPLAGARPAVAGRRLSVSLE